MRSHGVMNLPGVSESSAWQAMRSENALHFVIQLASEPKSGHPQITHKRPEGIVKSGWLVALECKVPKPRAAIRSGDSGRQITSAPGSQPRCNSENAYRCAQYVEGLRFLFVMCRQIVGPKFFERSYPARLFSRGCRGRPCHFLPSCADRRSFVQCFSHQTCSASSIGLGVGDNWWRQPKRIKLTHV
jgi:hypothetical protein